MGLLDEVISEPRPARRTKMDEIQASLSDADYKDFLVALLDNNITQAALVRVLKRRGIHVAGGTISTMRRDYQQNMGG